MARQPLLADALIEESYKRFRQLSKLNATLGETAAPGSTFYPLFLPSSSIMSTLVSSILSIHLYTGRSIYTQVLKTYPRTLTHQPTRISFQE